jgi:hypothetical protein
MKEVSNMKRYNSYHTIVKQLVKRNNLPDTYLDQIDRSTIWRWKQEEKDKYVGHELSNIEVLEEFISRREVHKVMRYWLKIACSISHILDMTKHFHDALKSNISPFVRSILRYQNNIDIKLV